MYSLRKLNIYIFKYVTHSRYHIWLMIIFFVSNLHNQIGANNVFYLSKRLYSWRHKSLDPVLPVTFDGLIICHGNLNLMLNRQGTNIFSDLHNNISSTTPYCIFLKHFQLRRLYHVLQRSTATRYLHYS